MRAGQIELREGKQGAQRNDARMIEDALKSGGSSTVAELETGEAPNRIASEDLFWRISRRARAEDFKVLQE
jgi:hypothetical protein